MSTASGATGAVPDILPYAPKYPYKQIFNNIQWTRLPDLQRILNKDVSTYRTAKEVLADLNRIRAYITPPPVKDAQGKEIIIDSIYSCRITPVSVQRIQLTAKDTTLANELVGNDTTGVSRTYPASQCTFVRTPLTGGNAKVSQYGGQVTLYPTATFRSQAPNLAVLLYNLNNMKTAISPDTYGTYIDENKKRVQQQQALIDNIDQRMTILKQTEQARLQKGVDAINKVMTQQQQDQLKLTETFTGFDTSLTALKDIFDAAVAKSAELEGRYAELQGEEGGMFGGRRRVNRKRKRTRKMRRMSRKATRKN